MRIFHKFYTVLLVIIISSTPLISLQTKADFPDITGHKYQEGIVFLKEKGVVQGYSDGNFLPNNPLNRAEMLKILLENEFKGSSPESGYCFEDVKDEWYAKYVCKAKADGIINGYPDGLFRPGQEVNMAEGLKMAFESFDLQIEAVSGENWFQPYVEFAHQSSLFSKHSYLPSRSMTRGEMSYLVHQLVMNREGIKPLSETATFLSNGCGKLPPATPATQSIVEGQLRSYITVIPSDYDYKTPKKIIFAFHGRTNSNEQVRGYYGIERVSNNEAIIIYPSGLPTETSPRNWQDLGDPASDLRDYALFDQLLAEFSNNYCIDLDEVYVVGHSLGAWFTNSLACFRGDVIRAVGSLGGGTSIGDCTGPVATMIWHNPNDNLAPFYTGEQARDQYVRQNQCSYENNPTELVAGNCVEYKYCYDNAPLVWCPHTINTDGRGNYYPHNWPKETGAEIWNFFKSLEN